MYSPQVLDHFENPRNAGSVVDPDASVRVENPACGDILQLTLKIADDKIEEICFRCRGCVASMACASALTEMVQGSTIEAARNLSKEELIDTVGGLPQASSHAADLALDALAAALDQLSVC
jgi:nitrogen fixation protein NifU and related proteins